MNILLLPIGKRAYMIEYFQAALGKDGEVHASNSEMSPALYAADKYFVSEPVSSQSYAEGILNYCIGQNISAVIPLSDFHTPALSKEADKFTENNIRVIAAPYSIVEMCNDKWLSYEFMKEKGILTPKTYLSQDEFIRAESAGEIAFPAIVKPRFGMGSLATFSVNSFADLDLHIKFSELTVNNSYLKYITPAEMKGKTLIQEKILGTEYGMDIINDLNGNYRTTFIKNKLGIVNGETNPAVFEDVPAVSELGKQIGEAIHHPGDCNADCMFDGTNAYALDINPRFGGCYPYSHLAGADIPRAIIAWLKGEEPDESNLKVKIGTMCYKDAVAKLWVE